MGRSESVPYELLRQPIHRPVCIALLVDFRSRRADHADVLFPSRNQREVGKVDGLSVETSREFRRE